MIVKSNVVALLVKEFGVGNPDLANRDEKKLARALKAMLDRCVHWDDFEVEEEEELDVEEDLEQEELYVVLQEVNGHFPQQGHFTASNLVIDCHTSHMMTKRLMMNWLTACVFTPDMPHRMVLVVDSWSSFKDHAAIQSMVPNGKTLEIRNIPPGATSKIQPLDVYFFITFKGFMKRISGYVSSNELALLLYQRDNILEMLSLICNQFCAPRFQHFLQYSWYACGYVDKHPPPFLNPVQYCFSPDAVQKCQLDGCDKTSFIQCALCEKCLCFDHFYTQIHYHEGA
jgi:hypothetical protein